MSDLVVLAFDTEEGALEMRDKLLRRKEQRHIPLADAAVVIRREDGKVKVKQLHSLVGAGAVGGFASAHVQRVGVLETCNEFTRII